MNTTVNGNGRSTLPDAREVSRRFAIAVREALLDHKRAGNPVAMWKGGQVVVVPPQDILVTENGHDQADVNSEHRNGDAK